MKIEGQKEKSFRPFSVTFTFETEAEAKFLWSCLNMPTTKVEEHKAYGLLFEDIVALSQNTWEYFDKQCRKNDVICR